VETLLRFPPPPGQPRVIRYGAAVVLVAVFFLLSLGAGVAAGPFEFVILILSILLASVLYDRGSGFLATGLGVLVMASQLDWQADPVEHLVALTVFGVVGGVKLIDSTLVIVLHNGEQEIERELAPPADALRVALMILARRGRLEIGDVLKVMARTE